MRTWSVDKVSVIYFLRNLIRFVYVIINDVMLNMPIGYTLCEWLFGSKDIIWKPS